MRLLLISIFVIFLTVLLTPNAFAVQYPVLIHGGVADNREMNFSPSEIEIQKGDTIIWKNLERGVYHTVTSASGLFDERLINCAYWKDDIGICGGQPKATFSYTFEEFGTYDYNCKLHSWMNGVVKVIEFGQDAEIQIHGYAGDMYIDKSVYEVGAHPILIKIYGTVKNPGGGDKVIFSITDPNGDTESQTTFIKQNGEYQLVISVNHDDVGTYSATATFAQDNIGTASFAVVKRSIPEELISKQDHESLGLIEGVSKGALTVNTDLSSYKKDDTIRISGITPYLGANQQNNSQVTIQVINPQNNIVTVSQVSTRDDGTYSTSINSEGPLFRVGGAYTIKVNYATEQISTKFFLSVPPTFNSPSPAPPTQSKTPTILTLNTLPSTVKAGETLRFSGSLKTTDGIPVANEKIFFRNGVNELGSINTHEDGTFSGTREMHQIGNDYMIFAFFYGGSSNFETAKSQTYSLKVFPVGFPVPPEPTQPEPTQPDDNPYAGIAGLLIIVVIIAGIVIGIKGARKKRSIQYQTIGGSGPQPPPKPKATWRRKPKPKVQPQGIEDYDLGPLLYCPNVACRSEHLQTKANGQKYCTKCGWNK